MIFADEAGNQFVTGDVFETVTGKLSGGLRKEFWLWL